MGASLSSIGALAKAEVEGYDWLAFWPIQDGLCNTHAAHVYYKGRCGARRFASRTPRILQGVAPLTSTSSARHSVASSHLSDTRHWRI